MQARHRHAAQTRRNALDRARLQRHHRPPLLKTQRPLSGLLGTENRTEGRMTRHFLVVHPRALHAPRWRVRDDAYLSRKPTRAAAASETGCAERLLHMRLEEIHQDPNFDLSHDQPPDQKRDEEKVHVSERAENGKNGAEKAQPGQHDRQDARPVLQLPKAQSHDQFQDGKTDEHDTHHNAGASHPNPAPRISHHARHHGPAQEHPQRPEYQHPCTDKRQQSKYGYSGWTLHVNLPCTNWSNDDGSFFRPIDPRRSRPIAREGMSARGSRQSKKKY